MKVSSQAREKFMELCKRSTHKSNTYSEIDFKIVRAAELGKQVSKNEVLYYDLILHVKNETVLDIIRDKTQYYHLSERAKVNYTYKNEKILI